MGAENGEDAARKKGSRSRDGGSSGSSSDESGDSKKSKKRKNGNEENVVDEAKIIEQLNGRLPPSDYKTRMCNIFLEGKCSKSDCNLCHSQAELMQKDVARNIMQKFLDGQKAQKEEEEKKQQELKKQEEMNKQKEAQAAKKAKVSPAEPYYGMNPQAQQAQQHAQAWQHHMQMYGMMPPN